MLAKMRSMGLLTLVMDLEKGKWYFFAREHTLQGKFDEAQSLP